MEIKTKEYDWLDSDTKKNRYGRVVLDVNPVSFAIRMLGSFNIEDEINHSLTTISKYAKPCDNPFLDDSVLHSPQWEMIRQQEYFENKWYRIDGIRELYNDITELTSRLSCFSIDRWVFNDELREEIEERLGWKYDSTEEDSVYMLLREADQLMFLTGWDLINRNIDKVNKTTVLYWNL